MWCCESLTTQTINNKIMDRMRIQEVALLRMKRYGEVEWREGINGKMILHSVPDAPKPKRKHIPQMEVKHGFD